MYCNTCGQFVEYGNSKCPNCGAKVNYSQNNIDYYDSTDALLDGGSRKLPIILACSSLISFILGIVAQKVSFLALILFLISFILSEIGIKQSKKYNLKLWKIINSILGIISILYFVVLLFNIIGAIAVRNRINQMWTD